LVVDGKSVVYIEDGTWGRNPRLGTNVDEWYIAEFASKTHVIIVTLDGATHKYEAVNVSGEMLDTYTRVSQFENEIS